MIMGILSNLMRGLTAPRTEKKVIQTKYGGLDLAREADRRRAKGIMASIQQTTEALTRKDMRDWRRAWQLAISADSPDRRLLYSIYTDVSVDLHLSGCIDQRRGLVMSRSFKIVDAGGNTSEGALHYFRQEWFRQLMRHCLDARYWGHSLIELGSLTTDGDGCPCYDGVTLIPRPYVIPGRHRVITDLGQDWTAGIDYHEKPFAGRLIEAGGPDDLGLFLKAATQTIPKKNTLAFWDTFAEIFGMPMRIGHTTCRDEKELQRMEGMMAGMGTEFWALFPEGTDIEVVESSKGDAYNVYDRRIDRANSELSKLIVGQTMTVEDGSSLSQSQTHLKVLENLVEDDAAMLRDIINNQLLPRMVSHGFPLKGLSFEWDCSVDYTPEQKLAYERFAGTMYDIAPEYFEREYSIPAKYLLPKAEPAPAAPAGTLARQDGQPDKIDGARSTDFFD